METVVGSGNTATAIQGQLQKSTWESFLRLIAVSPALSFATFLITLLTVFCAASLWPRGTQIVGNGTGDGVNSVPAVPYRIPFLGHVFAFFTSPSRLMSEARDASPHGIFSLKLGPTTHNIISDPSLVKSVMQQKESTVQFKPIAWQVMVRFFGTPSRMKNMYHLHWDNMNKVVATTLMREPSLGAIMKATIDGLQLRIPEMITFTANVIDQQPWEKSSDCTLISSQPPAVEINLLSVLRDLMGYAAIPAFFGQSFLENYPQTLQDIYDMDLGMKFFMMGLPRWFPFPGVAKAHIARHRLWNSTTDFYTAYDDFLDGKPVGNRWGDMNDVCELTKERALIYKENGFAPRDRAEISILWALVINANVSVYWMIIHILAQPEIATRIREEIKPYIEVSKPYSIGAFSETPKLTISHDGLAKACPLLRAAFFETLRLCNQPWSVRQLSKDISISTGKSGDTQAPNSYGLKNGEYITVPHDLHMLDPAYFPDPHTFKPDRFLETAEDGSVSVNIGSIRPFGGGPSMCKGRIYAERECLSFVAGILGYYDIEPAGSAAWVIPAQQKATAISLPVHETRVRIKRRVFDWEK